MTDQENPEKSSETGFRFLQRVFYGDAVKDEAAALGIAEILIRSSFGEKELDRQKPLSIWTDDDCWIIQGSFNKDESKVGEGPVIVRMNKAHATIESMYLRLITPPGYLPGDTRAQ
jgi:hypothetical protein